MKKMTLSLLIYHLLDVGCFDLCGIQYAHKIEQKFWNLSLQCKVMIFPHKIYLPKLQVFRYDK